MATYIELRSQIEALQKEAESVKTKERKEVIARMKEAIAAYEISAAELGLSNSGRAARSAPGRKKAAGAAGKKRRKSTAAVAYADGNGNTWVGRGKRPRWLKEALEGGAKLEDFAKKSGK